MHCLGTKEDGALLWYNPKEAEEDGDAAASSAGFANPNIAIPEMLSLLCWVWFGFFKMENVEKNNKFIKKDLGFYKN